MVETERITNTTEIFEFRPGGRWKHVMHGPNGHDYPNEAEFVKIVPYDTIEIRHIAVPFFLLSVTLAENEGRTTLSWRQIFDEPQNQKFIDFVLNANEENLDRLEAVLRKET